MHFTRSVILSAVVSGAFQLASAQLGTISTGCQNALFAVAGSTEGQCINAVGLAGLYLQSNTSSVISPVNSWLQGLCGIGSCTNASLIAISNNVTAGCSTDLAPLLGGATPSQVATLVQVGYPTLRQVLCLKESSTLCVTQYLTNIQSNVGTVTLTELFILLFGGGATNLPASTVCTNCNKQSYNLEHAIFPTLVNSTQESQICGASFIDGSTPPGITETAINGTYGSTIPSGAIPTISGVQTMLLSSLIGSALLVILA